MLVAQSIGCDISQKDFKANFSIMDDQRNIKIKASRTFANTTKGFEALQKWIDAKVKPELPLIVVMEATGVYYEALAYYLFEHQYELSVQLPNKTKKYAQSLGLKSKTDKIDARMLAQLGLERKLELWNPSSANMRQLKKLCRQRVRLIELKTMVSNQLHAEQNSYGSLKEVLHSLQQTLAQLKQQIATMEKHIHQLFVADEQLKKHYAHICKIKGLGLITLATIIAETDGFALFRSRSQLVSYAGYDVVYNQSGNQIRPTRISKKGNRYIRRALYFPAISVVKHEQPFKQLYQRILERRQRKMVALVAVQRKLLTIIFALYKSEQQYDPNYQNTYIQANKVALEQLQSE